MSFEHSGHRKSRMLSFRKMVWAYYRAHGRHDLPWRPPSLKLREGKQDDVVYKILVSEVMLQQTQVERVLLFYKNFLKKFPTARALGQAPLADVLAAWQGLGYNRRAKLLREAAKEMSQRGSMIYHTSDPEALVRALEGLPGVGPYTARAVAAFAYNEDVVFIETNIRTAVTHHFFREDVVRPTSDVGRTTSHTSSRISDKEIETILKDVLPPGRAREWYGALMDYGAHLKRSGVRINARSAHYAKQAKFEGSLREVRGAILRALTKTEPLAKVKKHYPERFDRALAALAKDGLITKKGKTWRIT